MKINQNAHGDKIDAQREQWLAKIALLKANLKEAAADARISIQQQIDELEKKLS